MIRKLNQHLGISLEILMQEHEQSNNKLNIENINWSKFPIKEMIKRKWISITSKAKLNPPEIIAEFFKPIGGLAAQGIMWRRSFHNRVANDINGYNLKAWSARVMILAEQIEIEDFNKSFITMDFLRDIAKLSQFNKGPLLAKEKLANIGIKLIFQKQLAKTKIDGCCFLDKKGHPVIGMTLRYDRIDYFWFTLLHELAHAYKHLTNSDDIFIDDLYSETPGTVKEKEADDIACEAFIPKSIWKENNAKVSHDKQEIIELSKKLSISPAIIAGRIRYETNDYTKFSDLIGNKQVENTLKEYIND
jgi:HTH-type transcriptional regulator/antitoxin HigA